MSGWGVHRRNLYSVSVFVLEVVVDTWRAKRNKRKEAYSAEALMLWFGARAGVNEFEVQQGDERT